MKINTACEVCKRRAKEGPIKAGKRLCWKHFNLLKNRYELVDFVNPDKGPAIPATPSVTPSITPTISVTPSITPSISVSASVQVTPTPSITPANLPFYAVS